MTDTQLEPEALQLADLLESVSIDVRQPEGTLWARIGGIELDKAAAELRRLCEENAQLRSANAYAADVLHPMGDRIAKLEAALTQAVGVLESFWRDVPMNDYAFKQLEEAISTARQTLGDT